MENPDLSAQIEALTEDARDLAHSIREDDEQPAERTRRRAHQLREHLGVALILSERLARQKGNGEMLKLEDREDGTGRVSYTANVEPKTIER